MPQTPSTHFIELEVPQRRTACGRGIIVKENGWQDPEFVTREPELVDCRACEIALAHGRPVPHRTRQQLLRRNDAVKRAALELRRRHMEEFETLFREEVGAPGTLLSVPEDVISLRTRACSTYTHHLVCPLCWAPLSLNHVLQMMAFGEYTEEAMEMFRRESARQRRSRDSRIATALDRLAEDLD